MSTANVKIDKKIKQKIEEPKKYKVIVLNDNSTPMDFVVNLLSEIFKHTQSSAEEIMMTIHTTGSGVAGIYNFEIAEVKAVEATQLARASGYPLQLKIEEEWV